jgi:hypothetical protein
MHPRDINNNEVVAGRRLRVNAPITNTMPKLYTQANSL